MERIVHSLAYKGSISDAIHQSRQQKKLFVVYISGEDDASSSFEQSTLDDKHVAEVIRQCCIFLHLKQGNMDAAQFSAIYPQKSVPSISVIGLNGVMLWHHEGHIISESLKESIEKAWAALHLQETAATLLTASLSSRNAESVNANSTDLPHQQGCSTSGKPCASSSQPADIPGANGVDCSTDLVPQLPSTTHAEPLLKNGKEGSESVSDPVDRTVEKLGSACTEFKSDLPDSSRSSNKGSSSDPIPSPKRKNKVDGCCTEVPLEASSRTITSSGLSSQLLVEQDKATTSSTPDEVLNSVKSDDIHLSIRMPTGNRLEIKLMEQDVLREVKNFVDENLGTGVGSYDLSLIYPKRVFTEQDMEATLRELGIHNRHAMMVVPHRQTAQVPRPQLSSVLYDAGGNSGGGGYFGYLRTVLSYANPLSYLRGSPTSNPELQANADQEQNRTSSGQWNHPGMGSQEESRPNTLRRRTRQFGSNVHTLGSEDQSSSDDRNVFWNGNSTELFLLGLKKYGKGDWRNISRNFVHTRTPTQVASHAQKYFIRLNSGGKDKRRSSIHDITTVNLNDDQPPSPSQCSLVTNQSNGSTVNAANLPFSSPSRTSGMPAYGIGLHDQGLQCGPLNDQLIVNQNVLF